MDQRSRCLSPTPLRRARLCSHSHSHSHSHGGTCLAVSRPPPPVHQHPLVGAARRLLWVVVVVVAAALSHPCMQLRLGPARVLLLERLCTAVGLLHASGRHHRRRRSIQQSSLGHPVPTTLVPSGNLMLPPCRLHSALRHVPGRSTPCAPQPVCTAGDLLGPGSRHNMLLPVILLPHAQGTLPARFSARATHACRLLPGNDPRQPRLPRQPPALLAGFLAVGYL